MDASIKSLTITGPAAEDATRARLKASGLGSRRKRTSVKAEKDEEDEFIEQAKRLTLKPEAPIEKPVVIAKPVVQQVIQPVKPDIQTNVILNPPKQSRVKLQPKLLHSPVKQSDMNTTRKARRIKLNMSNLTHRFTRAKKVRDENEKKPMEVVREYLIQKGVIQAKSKAPEKMLRSMYSDFMLLKDQTL